MKKPFLEHSANWVLLAPVANVMLTKKVGLSFRINRATLVSAKSLPYRWQQLGLPARVSDLRKGASGYLEQFFDGVKTFVVARFGGRGDTARDTLLPLIREELAILALSQLGYAKRHSVGVPAIANEYGHRSRSYLLADSDNVAWTQQNQTIGSVRPLVLDPSWRRFSKDSFFEKLLRILRGDVEVQKGWRQDLRNAAVLAGQSQCSVDLPQAFLWNMIALELLLTRDGDKVVDALPTRAEAFLGWTGYWDQEGYEDGIRAVYKKRCRLVHQGKRDDVSLKDVYFTDDLILNLLRNIVGHSQMFTSKDAVVNFSKKLEAERVLGVDVKVRPRTLTFSKRHYRPRDFVPR